MDAVPPVDQELMLPAASVESRVPQGSWVIVAAFNEQDRIGGVLAGLLPIVPNVVVVDDGSRDGTADLVRATSAWLIRHPVNFGQGAALQTGLAFALSKGATHLVTFDADGQHVPSDVARLLNALGEHRADFALGSRFLGQADGIPASRRILLWLAIQFTRLLSGVRLSDAHNGLRAMTRRGAQQIHLTFNRMEHASELIDQIVKSGLRFVEVPVHIRYTADSLRKGQRASAAIGQGVRLLLDRLAR